LINNTLGIEVGLGPGHIVVDEDPAPPTKRGTSDSHFTVCICINRRPCLLCPNGWMDQDAIWYGCRPWPGRHCVRWGPRSPPRKGAQQPPPTFRPTSIVAKLSPISTAEFLFYSRCRVHTIRTRVLRWQQREFCDRYIERVMYITVCTM